MTITMDCVIACEWSSDFVFTVFLPRRNQPPNFESAVVSDATLKHSLTDATFLKLSNLR